MIDQAVKARVHLYGLFKVLELLPEYDTEAAALISDTRVTVEFRVSGVGRARLCIDHGRVTHQVPDPATGSFQGGSAQVVLWFPNAAHLNGMIAGTKQPIPIRGFTRLGFLSGPFTKFMGSLEKWLMPTDEALRDPAFFAANTRMTAYLAFHALSEIANYDQLAKVSARAIPDGVIQLEVINDIGLYLTCAGGHLTTSVGRHQSPRCVLWFADLQALNDLLTGRVHTYDLVALGSMGMRGFVPMIDHLNPILGLIAGYLK